MKRRLLVTLSLAVCAQAARAADPDPCADFYAYVNQAWQDTTELPPDRARVGSFDTLALAHLRLLEGAAAELAAARDAPASPGLRLVAADWAAGQDAAAIEARGLAALAPWLARIDTLKDGAGLPALQGALATIGVAAPLSLSVSPDARDRRRHALYVRQSGLGLPDRDDYTATGDRADRLRAAYRLYTQRLLEAAGHAPTAEQLDALFALERGLAEASVKRAALRDPVAIYNSHDAASLATLAPGPDWAAWLAAYGAPAGQRVVVDAPAFVQGVARLAAQVPAETWRLYLQVRLLDAYARRLPPRFAQAAFDFHDGAVRGLRQPPPRAEQVLRLIEASPVRLGLGELFAARAFSPRAQQRALQMVADVRAAMRARIERLAWMSPATRERALAKLAAMAPKIGVPERWPVFESLQFRRDDFAGNALAAAQWQTRDHLADLQRPVDRQRWNASPHVVNAFAGGLNDIVFPAGILQPPFFDEQADDATNYGAIGSVIGHEITHHFDDRGRQFDADGNLADWWTAEDAAAYRQRADRVAALYGGFEPVPGQRIDGRLTLGENISDLSGLQIAYDALQIALARNPPPPGATPAQRFFMANATMWRSKRRIESLVTQLRTDSQSPGEYRVRVPMANLPAFAAAFQCKPGSPMAAGDPIVIW